MADHSVNSSEIKGFLRFDVAANDSDHYYRNTNMPKKDGGGDCFTNGSSTVYKKIMQEWKILEKNLPDTITVRVYENRIDLLRAAIVGAAGTPYHDGLFFFDVAFPSDYPSQPPKVHYHSFGLGMNPNLYPNGTVCLSLLNTWFGYKSEKWDPSKSTILQVLVSIQGLVLNEKPFFNEPGLGGWVGRTFLQNSARTYDENVFVSSCKTMVFLLRKPPKNFESFVADHFRNRGNSVLEACKAYKNGEMRAGYYTDHGSSSSSSLPKSSVVKVSSTFKASMEFLYPQLLAAFTKAGCAGAGAGASLGIFVEHPDLKRETVPSKAPPPNVIDNKTLLLKPTQGIKKAKIGITAKIISNLKKIFGLKKGNAKP